MDIKTDPVSDRKTDGIVNLMRSLEKMEQHKNIKAIYFYKWKSILTQLSSPQSVSPNSHSVLEEVSFSKRNSLLDTTRSGINAARHKKNNNSLDEGKPKPSLALYKAGLLTIKSILLLYIARVFFMLKEFEKTQAIQNKYQSIILKSLFKQLKRRQHQVIRRYFKKWESESSRSLKGLQISDSLKGRMLLSLFKNQSFLNKRSAFFKWKVKSNTRYLKAALAKFIMYPKINKYTSFWRLTTVLESKHVPVKPTLRYGRVQNSLLFLRAVITGIEKRNLSLSFYSIYKRSDLRNKRTQSLKIFDKMLKRTNSEAFEKIKLGRSDSNINENRKFALKALLKSPNVKHLAFYRWKEFTLKERIRAQNKVVLFSQAFPQLLDSLLKERLKYSFAKLACETDLSRKKRNAMRFLITQQRAKWERAFWQWRKFSNQKVGEERKILNSLEEAAVIISRIQAKKLKNALTVLQNNVIYQDQEKKKAIMILVNSLTSQMQKSFHLWHSKKEYNKIMESSLAAQRIFDIMSSRLNSQLNGVFLKADYTKTLSIFQKMAFSYKIKLASGFQKWKQCRERHEQNQVRRRNEKEELSTLFRATNNVFTNLNSALQGVSTTIYSKQTMHSNKAVKIIKRYLQQRILRIFLKWHVETKTGRKRAKLSNRKFNAETEELETLQLIYVLDKLSYEPQLSKLRRAFDRLKDYNSIAKRKAFILARMSQVIKTKQAFVFEIWKGVCTQKLLKSFYDVILLEKSLVNYANSVKAYAFHKICTAGLLEYWRTFNSALWKWKLANVEARYFSKQKVAINKSKAIFTIMTILDRCTKDSARSSFQLLKKEKKQREI